MAAWLDVCKFVPTLGGTTDWTFSSVVQGYQSPTAAGAVNGTIYRYRAESADLTQWEIGYGAYTSGSGVFARTTVLFNSSGTTAKINFSAAPNVAIVALKEDLISITEANSFTTTEQAQVQRNIGVPPPPVGSVRSLKILRGSATTLTVTADEIVMETALGGVSYREVSASHTLTISGTGANGMDTGAAPTSGYLAVYSITKGDGSTFAVLGVNVATNNAPLIYPGASMPSGYIASTLIGIWPTNSSAQFPNGTQIGTHFYYPSLTMPALGTGLTASVLTSISATAGIPPNPPGKIILADMVIFQTTASQRGALCAAGDATGTGFQGFNYASGAVASTGATSAYLPTTPVYSMSAFKGVPALTSQTLYWADAVGNSGNSVYVSGYDWGNSS